MAPGGQRMTVRYQGWLGWSSWTECESAAVVGEVLVITHDDGEDWIPLHVVRGTIEYRPRSDTERQSAP